MSDQDAPGMASLGGTVSARVAEHLRRVVVRARQEMGPHQAGIAQLVLRDFTNHVSDEIRSVMSPLWMSIADSPDVPEHTRALARSLGTQRGQAWAWIGGQATSAAMGAGLIALLTNELQPVTGAAMRGNPHMPLAVADAAAADVRGLSWGPDLYADAGQWGINRDRFEVIKRLHESVPTPGEINAMLNRGLIGVDEAAGAYRRAGFAGAWVPELIRLREHKPSIADVAAMWNRGILDTQQAVHMGRAEGVSDVDVQRYLELGGEPPAVQELLLAWRRGVITEAQLDRALRQGPLRFEWIDVIKALQWAPLPAGEAADAVNQGHMSVQEGARVAAESGIRAEDFDVIIRNAGLPPGLEVVTEALNRGLIDEAEFDTAFLESRLKNKYVPLYRALRWRVVPQETVRRLYRLGSYTLEQARERLQHNGFSPEDASALLAAEGTEAGEATRELTKTEILALYTDRAVTQTEASDMLGDLGYGDGEIGWLLAIADSRRERRFVDATITRLRAGYVAYRLTDAEASSIMDRLRIPPAQRDELISLWDLERLAVTRGLTTAQIQTAMRRGLIDGDGARLRFLQAGYSPDDADILVSLAQPAPR